MGGDRRGRSLIAHNRTLYQLLDEQAQISPNDQALRCADGDLTYQELSSQSCLWARHMQERTFGLTGAVVPIYMPSSSMWTIVAMFAVLRIGGVFAFIDSSLPGAARQLQSTVSAVNASCVILGPAEYRTPEIRSATPSALCFGAFLKPRDDFYGVTEGFKRLLSPPSDTFYPVWALLGSNSTTVTLHHHSAVISAMGCLRNKEEVFERGGNDTKSHQSQSGLVLWPFIVRHDTLLDIFATIIQGGLVQLPREDTTPETMRRLLSQHSQHWPRIYVPPHRLLDVSGFPGDIFVYGDQWPGVLPPSDNTNPVYLSHNMGCGRILVTSIRSDGSLHITGASGDVSVVNPENIELQASIGITGELIIRDSDIVASCTILHGPSTTSQTQDSLLLTGKVFRTGLSACIQLNGSIQILHQVEETEPIAGIEAFQQECSKEQDIQDNKALTHLPSKDTQNLFTDRMHLLRRLWADVLGLDQDELRSDDKFLDSGGDSLKAAQLVSLARVHDLELPVIEVFTGNLSLQDMTTCTLKTDTLVGQDGTCSSDQGIDMWKENGDQVENDNSKTPLSQIVLPEWIHSSNIEKIIPATGWQASMAGNSTLKAQHWADCWVINLYGPLSVDCLQLSCASLLEKHEILRSVFAAANGDAWQLVVRASHYPMDFTLHQTRPHVGETLDSMTHDLWNDTKNAQPELDRKWVRFMVIKHNMNHHRLLVRLTHAQYDAGSIPAVIEHLRISYQAGSRNPESVATSIPQPQFSRFVAWANRKEHVQAAEVFWRTRLSGSKPTYLRNTSRDGPSTATTGLDHVINERISSPEIILDLKNLRGIMPSTIISAAWSAVLMFLTDHSDVVCGIITSGRHNAMIGIDQVIGPCWNMLPVRTQRQGPEQTVLELLQQVQRNQQTALAHELLPFRHIVEKCTGWSPWTNLCSIINFENVSIPRAGGVRQVLSPDVEIDFAPLPGPVSGPTDFWVAVTPFSRPNQTGITLELRFDNRRVSRDYSSEVMRLFSKMILLFTEDPEALTTDAISRAAASLDKDADGLRKCVMRSAASITAVLDKTWTDVLGCISPADEPSRLRPYYDVHGEVIFAAAIAQNLRRKLSVDISTEVVMSNPSLSSLENWLMHKMKLDL